MSFANRAEEEEMLVGYARVSTRDQDLSLQIDALKAAGCERIFTETASGAQRDRPELKAALDYLRRGDTLVVWKLDRLARSLKQLIETVEQLERLEVGFKSLTEEIDTTCARGRLIFHIFAALAEFERMRVRDRTLAGLQAARTRGRLGGRPRGLSEKDVKVTRTLLLDPDLSVKEIAHRLKVACSILYRYFPGKRGALGEGL